MGFFALLLAVLTGSALRANPPVGADIDLAALSPAAMTSEANRLALSGVRSVRLHLDWNRIEPARGRFDWQADDASVRAALAQGLEIVAVLGPTARWAVDPNSGLDPALQPLSVPHALRDWEEYVRRVASRYRGKIAYWQIREEPNGRNFRGDVWTEYAALLTCASAALRSVDPAARIILPEITSFDAAGLDWWLHAPSARAWDIVGTYAPAPAALGRSALRLSCLSTEVDPPGSPDCRPAWLVGSEGMLSADEWLQNYLLVSACGLYRAYVPAEAVSEDWVPQLSDLQYTGSIRLGPVVWALAFQDRKGPVVAIWSAAPTTLPASELGVVRDADAAQQAAAPGHRPGSAVTWGAGQQLCFRLGPRPVLIRGLDVSGSLQVGPPSRARVLAATGRPDLSALPAVLADYNRPDPEQGLANRALRTLTGGLVREERHGDRVALGTSLQPSARDPNEDVSCFYFDIDDSWLYLARGRVPILITIECERSLAGPERVGFQVRYDSVRGSKATPWRWVEPGTGWTTYQVAIRDGSFTGRSGYDFYIDAKGSRQNLWISSVKVEKLSESARPSGAGPVAQTPGAGATPPPLARHPACMSRPTTIVRPPRGSREKEPTEAGRRCGTIQAQAAATAGRPRERARRGQPNPVEEGESS